MADGGDVAAAVRPIGGGRGDYEDEREPLEVFVTTPVTSDEPTTSAVEAHAVNNLRKSA
jgi:hypothetical protein